MPHSGSLAYFSRGIKNSMSNQSPFPDVTESLGKIPWRTEDVRYLGWNGKFEHWEVIDADSVNELNPRDQHQDWGSFAGPVTYLIKLPNWPGNWKESLHEIVLDNGVVRVEYVGALPPQWIPPTREAVEALLTEIEQLKQEKNSLEEEIISCQKMASA